MLDRPLVNADLHALRELLGIPLLDFTWLMAIHVGESWVSKNSAQARQPVGSPVLSGLARLVSLHIEKDPAFEVLPRMPTARQVYDLLSAPYLRLTGRELNPERFAALCMVGPAAVGKWLRSCPITTRSQRHLFLLERLVRARGEKGLADYLKALDTEAKSRGFENLDAVVRARSWSKREVGSKPEAAPTKRTAKKVTRRKSTRARP